MDPAMIAAIGATVTALVGAAASIATTVISNNKTTNLMGYRLDQLEKKQDKHNSMIERVYHLEQRADLIDERQKVANHRIDDLEHETGLNARMQIDKMNLPMRGD